MSVGNARPWPDDFDLGPLRESAGNPTPQASPSGSRAWTVEELDRCYPLPDDWRWYPAAVADDGRQLWGARADAQEVAGLATLESSVWLDDGAMLRTSGLDDGADADVCLAVLLANTDVMHRRGS